MARVVSNDPANRFQEVEIKASIKIPIYISSRYVYLHGITGQQVVRVVDIMAKLHRPLSIVPVAFNLPKKLSYSIKEMEKGKRFRIRFTSNPGTEGRFNGLLRLKTNYPEEPEMTIFIRGRFEKRTS